MTRTLGIDSNGEWDAHQYAIDAGWDFHCVMDTAKLGIAEADAEGLSEEQQSALLAWCNAKAAERESKRGIWSL